jgi:hypothetical protein
MDEMRRKREEGKSARLVRHSQRQATRVNEAKARPRRILDICGRAATDFFLPNHVGIINIAQAPR